MFGWTRGQRQTIVRACASIAFTQGAMQSLQLLLWLSETYIYKEEKPLPGRLELPTLRLSASRSNQLSYGSTMIILKVRCRGVVFALRRRAKIVRITHVRKTKRTHQIRKS